MRKLNLKMEVSLDGFVGGPNGEVDWLFPDFDAEHAEWVVARLRSAGAHLMGSVTYRDMAAHWPRSDEPYAAPMNEIPKVVFSRTLTRGDWSETRIVAGDLAAEIERLKREQGGDLLAHGGARFARALLGDRLVDELWLIVHPVAIGNGLGLFSALAAPTRFEVVSGTSFRSGTRAMVLHPK